MTTPAGVPNLPLGALTVDTLAAKLQDQSTAAMRSRANERMPAIFGNSTGGNIAADLSPFGILAGIWSGVNSLIANADPADIQGPEDIPDLLLDFIEGLPLVGQFVQLLEAITGQYDGDDVTLNAIQDFLAPLINMLHYIFGGFLEDIAKSELLKPLFEWLAWFWGLFEDVVDSLLTPLAELVKWGWNLLGEVIGTSPEEIIASIFEAIKWAWATFGVPVLKALGGLVEWVSGVIDIDFLRGLIESITTTLGKILDPQSFVDVFNTIVKFFAGLVHDITNFNLTDFLLQLPVISTIVSVITGRTPADGVDLGLPTLGEWARDMEKMGKEAKEALDDLGQKLFGGLFPVGQLGASEPNLLSQGDFKVTETVTASDGWEYDGALTASGTGGSVKHVSTGVASTLYARQSIRVVKDDKLRLSAQVRNSGYSSGSMSLILIPWAGTARYTSNSYTVTMATRSTSTGSWTTITGDWTVPATVTSVTVALVSNVNSGCTARFDDIYLRKTGGLLQSNVDNLEPTWEGVWAATFGGSGVGKIWSDFITAITAINSDAGDALDDVGDLTTGLSTSPHSWIGSILSVVVDGVTNFQGFLNTLAIAMGGSGSANRVSHVGTRAAAVTGTADDAYENADDALVLAAGTNTAAYNAWYGSGGTGGTANMTAVINSIKSSVADGWTVEVINTSGTWTRPAPVDRIIEFWAICIGGGGGGDKGESKTTGSSGGDGGIPGRWMAKQITPSSIGSTVSVTVGAGGAGGASHLGSPSDNGGASSFGSLCSSSEALTASIGSLVGFYSASDSRPGVGGRGGDEAGGAKAGTGGGSTPLASGGAAGGVSGGQGASGGPGGNANLGGAIRAGGGGGGGGGASNTPLVGGVGGAGGRPGGGGGGGGAAWSLSPTAGGNGGDGGHGNVVLLYRIKT